MTPLVAQPSDLSSESIIVGANGELLDEQNFIDRGYSVRLRDGAVVSSIPFASTGGTRKVWSGVLSLYDAGLSIQCYILICLQSFVIDGVYHELYTVQLTYQQKLVDQNGVETKYNAFQQMATPAIPRTLFSINRELGWISNGHAIAALRVKFTTTLLSLPETTPEERVFKVFLGNIPFDVELVSLEMNGQEFSLSAAMQMGCSITRVPQENNTFAYILTVPFDAQFVVKQVSLLSFTAFSRSGFFFCVCGFSASI